MKLAATVLDRVALPQALVKRRARSALRTRLARLGPGPDQDPQLLRLEFLERVASRGEWLPSAPHLAWSSLPLDVLRLVLGPSLHAGAAFWPRWVSTVDEAATEWCRLASERLELRPGQRLLEIAAQPGSLSRWASQTLPDLDPTLLSSDHAARDLVTRAVRVFGPENARVSRSTLADFEPQAKFDRIVVMEGLSRSSNPKPLLDRLSSWLAPGGRMLIQLSCHWRDSYYFESGDENRWILPEFPDGALYPGQPLLDEFTRTLWPLGRWELSGEHYQRTVRAWLQRIETHESELLGMIEAAPVPHPRRTLRQWREALVAMEIMYGFRKGQEWCLTHLLLGAEAEP